MAKDNKKEPKVELKTPTAAGEDQTAKIPKPLKPGAGDDNKVVLNSGTDSAIRPSDATRMAPALVPPAQTEETVKLDGANPPAADDSTQKTVKPPVTGNAGKAKTIKLKPLKAASESDDNQEETLTMERDALLDSEMPALGGGAPAPAQEAAPAPSIDDEATIKIQKPTTKKPTHPVPNIPGAKETIKLRPSNTTPPPAAAAPGAGDDESQETVSMSKKTIRLVPKKPGETADDSTQKTAKPSAPTVKLTDSKGPAAAAAAAPAPPAGAPPAAAPPAAAKPSAPTVKLPEPKAEGAGATDSGSKKTLKLKSSAKTVSTSAPASSTESGAPPAGGAPPAKAAAAAKKPKKAKDPEKGSEPGVVMTIAAFFTLILIGYYAWMTLGQWLEGPMDETKSANVPGLSEKVKAPR